MGKSSGPDGASRRTRRPLFLVLIPLVALHAAAAIVACSSSSMPEDVPPDAAADTSVHDGGVDARPQDADAGPIQGGHCAPDGSPVTGVCDVVLQDCPDDAKGSKQECVIDGTKARCVPVQGSQQLGIGRACCANNATGNPCLPGLTCVGNLCEDGGPQTGRCSPACCDDKACGKSDPEGITGACDLTLVDDKNQPLYEVCSYRQRCQPFQVEPCKAGDTCLVEDPSGSASCIASFGKGNREPCSFANECADGFVCAGATTSICRTVCLLPNTVSPYDAGLVDAGAGKGGCPTGESCRISFTGLPAWYGACAYTADGG
ncbi:MAG: hypothetical protein JWP97_3589 [Labilithrix sp.]|nr:hypothetical protein [Labilithrix sp.]